MLILTSIDIHPLTPEPGLQQESLNLWSWSRRNLRYPDHIQKYFIASLHVSLSISHTSYLIFSQHCSPRWGYIMPFCMNHLQLSTLTWVQSPSSKPRSGEIHWPSHRSRSSISQARHFTTHGYAVHIIVPTFGWVVGGFVANTISKLR